MIDDPKLVTRAQVEKQVEELDTGMLAHVFSTCGAVLPKTPFALELAADWIDSSDAMRCSCGWGLFYEISKFKGKKAPEEEFFQKCIDRIRASIADQPKPVRESMKCALMGIGKRSLRLNEEAINAAEAIGSLEEADEGGCEPLDVMKHLTSPYLKEKLGY